MSDSLFDLFDDAGSAPAYPWIRCPKCGLEREDLDGFGFLSCTGCGFCTHPSVDGNVCGICGQTVGDPLALEDALYGTDPLAAEDAAALFEAVAAANVEAVDELYLGDVPEAPPPTFPSDPLPLVDPLPPNPPLPIGPPNGQGLLGDMFSEAELNDILSAQAFPRVDDDIAVDYRCPCCQYEWSGNPKPKLADAEADLAS